MQSAQEFVENYLGKEINFWKAASDFAGSESRHPPVVVEASESKTEAFVIVSDRDREDGYKKRFSLRRESGSWSLLRIQEQCVCRISGHQGDCEFCRGEGWM